MDAPLNVAAADRQAGGTHSDERHAQRERILTQPAPSRSLNARDAVVLKCDELFMIAQPSGDVPLEGRHASGLYYEDCRYLAGYELCVDGGVPIVLGFSSGLRSDTRHELIAPGPDGAPTTGLAISRFRRGHHRSLEERIVVRNHASEERTVRIELAYRAGFEDIFVLKGFATERGRLLPASVQDGRQVTFAYEGVDGIRRELSLAFEPRPAEMDEGRAVFRLRLPAASESEISVRFEPTPGAVRDPARGGGAAPRMDGTDGQAEVRTSDRLLDVVLSRAFSDLRLLRSQQNGGHFYEAGVPWFATLFGRDAATVALQLLPFEQRIARDTLVLLAKYQAHERDEYRDAEPGKILHELRSGELARAGLIPQSPAYYGTTDATLLFLILLDAYHAWTADRALLDELAPAARAALEWSTRTADHDGDGYLDYSGEYRNGLVNQGWKDSGDAIVNADGSWVRPPVALCEVQSYAYRAWLAGARILRVLGDPDEADRLERRSRELAQRFDRDFWWPEENVHVLALQRDGVPARVVSSNAGQVLWGGVTTAERARSIADRLMRDDMWSGWGIRTLSSDAAAYDPASYHRGTVWPHDNSLILAGLRRYGLDAPALRIFGALFEAASGLREHRLPELWSGYARRSDEERPVGYPVACSPQAWAAAALPYALTELLGIEPDAAARRLILRRPVLPHGIDRIVLSAIRLAGGSVSLDVRRSGDDVHVYSECSGGVSLDRVESTLQ